MTGAAFLEMVGSPGDSPGRWELGARTAVGRTASGDVTVPLAEVSRHHATIERRTHGFVITDEGSRNGTFINGERLGDDARRLNDADEIVLGGVVTLKFVDDMATPMAPQIGRLHGIWIDPETSAVWLDAQRVEPPLSDRQLGLLRMLYDADGAVVTRQAIIEQVWSDVAAEGVTDQAVSALVKRTRGRLAEYESSVRHIEIVKTRGIRLRNNA